MFKTIKNSNKGITLIALMVTIIVLVILASITLATLSGNNGLIVQAQNAKNQTELSDKRENQILKNILGYANYIGGGNNTPSGNTITGGDTGCSHVWNEGTVTAVATCTSTGTRTKTCTLCGATTTEIIAKNSNNHSGSVETAISSVTLDETINNASLYYTAISTAQNTSTTTDPIYHKVTQRYNCCGATVGNATYELHSGLERKVMDDVTDGEGPVDIEYMEYCSDCNADIRGSEPVCLDEGYEVSDFIIEATDGHTWRYLDHYVALYSIAYEHYAGWYDLDNNPMACYCHWLVEDASDPDDGSGDTGDETCIHGNYTYSTWVFYRRWIRLRSSLTLWTML